MFFSKKIKERYDGYQDDWKQGCFLSDGEYFLKDYIDEFLTPFLAEEFQMKYVGRYTWCGPWENHMCKVISLFLLKGDNAIFKWGYAFDFLLEVQSHHLRYFRTEKNIKPQFYNLPQTFIDSKEWQPLHSIHLHANDKKKLQKMICSSYKVILSDIKEWYKRVDSLEAVLKESQYQMDYQKYYRILSPTHFYIQSFVYAQMGDKEKAINLLKESHEYQRENLETQEKLMKKVETM